MARDGKRARSLRRLLHSRVSPRARQRARARERLTSGRSPRTRTATCGSRRSAAASRAGIDAPITSSSSATIPAKPDSLASDAVRTLLIDARGRIWVGTEHGLDVLDPKTGRARHFRHDARRSALARGATPCSRCMRTTPAECGSAPMRGLSRYEPATDDFVNYGAGANGTGLQRRARACHSRGPHRRAVDRHARRRPQPPRSATRGRSHRVSPRSGRRGLAQQRSRAGHPGRRREAPVGRRRAMG